MPVLDTAGPSLVTQTMTYNSYVKLLSAGAYHTTHIHAQHAALVVYLMHVSHADSPRLFNH